MASGDAPRLIETAFPLEAVSIDAVHEKNVRHGHISTLHIYPARRPLAACRAALIATLLPDPGNEAERKALLERLAGHVKTDKDGKRVTEGGILHWGRETSNAEDVRWFRERIREVYGNQAPKVLDPFAGGGSIPLEAMRLGCEATAIDLNPVAWFILKCTLEYPYLFAGKSFPLPEFIQRNRDFLTEYCKAKGFKGKKLDTKVRELLGEETHPTLQETIAPHDPNFFDADLAWHVRAWGRWVLNEARKTLAPYYPVYAEWQPLKGWNGMATPPPISEHGNGVEEVGGRWLRLVPLREDGTPTPDEELNSRLAPHDLANEHKPRWVTKPTVAYLWARTVRCQNPMCRATVPLLKTLRLCDKAGKRIVLTMTPTPAQDGVIFGITDKQVETAGTVTRMGAICPICNIPSKLDQIRYEGREGRIGATMTAVVVDGVKGKEYRLPTEHELTVALALGDHLHEAYEKLPNGLPKEPTPEMGGGASRAFSIAAWGFNEWQKMFTERQLLANGTIANLSRQVNRILDDERNGRYSEAIAAYLACSIDRLADRGSQFCRWDQGFEKIANTFTRFALPILWDYCEGNPLSETTGNFLSCVEWVAEFIQHGKSAAKAKPSACQQSAIQTINGPYDVIVTDPPYYDAIPYSDLMDFFYVWLRRTLHGLSPEFDDAFQQPLAPKWDADRNDGELIDDASRFGGDKAASRQAYEDGMRHAFERCREALTDDGRLVVVFASKSPAAWESLVSALVKAGFTVTTSWPIETEMGNRTVAQASAALASSVWIVCRKRPAIARPGWENEVLRGMRERITERLRAFWDAGIRGPDFVWSAFGPALEVYSKHPVVKKSGAANGGILTVEEFLEAARRMVVDFIVGRVFSEGHIEGADVGALDKFTAYYLLHRHEFAFQTAPIGACILFALSCDTTDTVLAGSADLLARPNRQQALGEENEDDGSEDDGKRKAQMVRLKRWDERGKPALGAMSFDDEKPPLIDVAHKLMQLWQAGDTDEVNTYIDALGLQYWSLFHQLLQALNELAEPGTDERTILEQIINYLKRPGRITAPERPAGTDPATKGQMALFAMETQATYTARKRGGRKS